MCVCVCDIKVNGKKVKEAMKNVKKERKECEKVEGWMWWD